MRIVFCIFLDSRDKSGVVLLLGMTVGGYIGAHVALKKGELWIKRLFVVVVTVACIKLLFFR